MRPPRSILEFLRPCFPTSPNNSETRLQRTYGYGNDAYSAVENARAQLAKAISARDSEIIFTSGATESINLAIKDSPTLHQKIKII